MQYVPKRRLTRRAARELVRNIAALIEFVDPTVSAVLPHRCRQEEETSLKIFQCARSASDKGGSNSDGLVLKFLCSGVPVLCSHVTFLTPFLGSAMAITPSTGMERRR